MKKYTIYIKTNEDNYIINANNQFHIMDLENWIPIATGCGRDYRYARGGYFKKSLETFMGAYRYKYENGSVIECSDEEIAQQEQAIRASLVTEPTTEDILNTLLGV